MKRFVLLLLVLAVLEFHQSESASLPDDQSQRDLLLGRTNQQSPFDDVTIPKDSLARVDADQATADDPLKITDLTSGQSRRRHLYQNLPETFEEFLKSQPDEEGVEESVAERTARGYFSEPREVNEVKPSSLERIPSAVRYPQHHGEAATEERRARTNVAERAMSQQRDSKLARDGDGSAAYNDRSAIFKRDGGAAYNGNPIAGQSRSDGGDGGDSGFMGDAMHQSLMAKLHDASANAFDQRSNIEFGPSPVGVASTTAAATPSYKPVYEAPSRQPDPRPHPGQRPAPLQPDDESDYRANGLDGSHRSSGDYRDGRVYQDQLSHSGPESARGDDYRRQSDYQGGEGNYRGQNHGSENYGDDGAGGEEYQEDDYRKDYRGDEYQHGGYGGGDYRDGDYEGGEDQRSGYAAFDPYKEAAQEEEAFRAVQGETDQYGEYSRSQGGNRYRDREESTQYPTRYEESDMGRGYEPNGDEYEGYREETRRRQPGEELKKEYGGYHGDQSSKRNGAHDNEDFERNGYHADGRSEQSRYYGNPDREHSEYRVKRHVYDQDFSDEAALKRQTRDLGSPDEVILVTEQVRHIHPVIHRHYEGVPLPARQTSPLPKKIPASVVKASDASPGNFHVNTEGIPSTAIFREDLPIGSFIARLALSSQDSILPEVVKKSQETVYVGPLSSAHAPQKAAHVQAAPVEADAEPLLREEAGHEAKFSPGVIHTGFVPILPLHHISKRALNSRASGHETSEDFLAGIGSSGEKDLQTTASFAKILEDSSDQSETAPSGDHVTFRTLPGMYVTKAAPADLVTSVDPVTSGDLSPAGSRRRAAVYQPHYDGYGLQQGRQNAEEEQDPYERYLPREDDNDPYFRYAPRDDIQHSHSLEQVGRAGSNVHEQYDLYGRPRQNSRLRRPEVEYDYEDYGNGDYNGNTRQDGGYPSYDDYEEDYAKPPLRKSTEKRHPDYDYGEFDDYNESGFHNDGRRGNRVGSNQRHQDNERNTEEYDDDLFEDYEEDQSQRFKNEKSRKEESRRNGSPLRPVTPGGARSVVQKFTPGIIQNGFVPITKSPHHVSKRSLTPNTSNEHISPIAEETKTNTTRSGQQDTSETSEGLTSSSGGTVLTFVDPVTSVDPLTSGDLSPAGSRRRAAVYQPHYDGYGRQQGRQNAEEEQDPYERYLPREDDNDPYFRYAPRESIQHSHHHEQDARTGGRKHVQFDLYGGQRKNSYQKRRPVSNTFSDYEEEEYEDGKRQNSDYPSYDDYEDDYTNPPTRNPSRKRYPDYDYDDRRESDRHGNGRRDNRRGRGQRRYQDNERKQNHDEDLSDYTNERLEDYEDTQDYEDNQREEHDGENGGRRKQKRRYPNRPAYYSGRYRGAAADERQDRGTGSTESRGYLESRRRYGDARRRSGNNSYDENKNIPRRTYENSKEDLGTYEDYSAEAEDHYDDSPREAAGGYDDTRRAVRGMLAGMAKKRKDGSCKEVQKDGMSCLQCSDTNGVKTEECAYSGDMPGSGRSGYSSSSSYGVPPGRQDGGRTL